MRHKTSFEFFNYWNRIKGSADAPLRAQIDPASIRHILPQIFILEITDIGQPRFRLAGTMICSLFGRELRDELFSSLWIGCPADNAVEIARGVMHHAAPAMLNAAGHTATGRSLSVEVILLPMRSSADRCDRLLGCLVPMNDIAWLGSEPLAGLSLERSRLLPDGTSAANAAPLEPKVAKSALLGKGVQLSLAVGRALNMKVFEGDRVD